MTRRRRRWSPDQLWQGLTLRGRCLVSAGTAAAVCGLALHEQDLVRVAVFLLALPVVAYVMVARTRYRLSCTRRLEPARVAAGRSADVVLRLENVSRLPTGVLLAEDTVPYVLGGRPRFVLDRVLPQRRVEVSYPVTSQLRGRFRVGPLTVRLADPFGMCELVRSFSAADLLVVTPAIETLPQVRLGGDWGGAGDSRARSVATSGEDDAATREYRQGDDLRRIHWRATAKRGELMVRREEQPWQSRAAVLLDARRGIHHGEGPTASLEWAVSAAASIGLHLCHAGFSLRLVGDNGEAVDGAGIGAESFDSLLLDVLAVRQPSSNATLQPALATLRTGGEGLIVAVVGPMVAEDAETMARMRAGGAAVAVAVVIDTSSWTTLPPRAAAAARQTFDDTCDVLESAGWRVLRASRGTPLADLWLSAGSAVRLPTSRGPRPSAPLPSGVVA